MNSKYARQKKNDDLELESKDHDQDNAAQARDDLLANLEERHFSTLDTFFSFKVPYFNKTINISYCDTFKIVTGLYSSTSTLSHYPLS